MVDDILNELNTQIQATLQALKQQLSKLRTGRANLGILDNVRVQCYGSSIPIHQCANLSVADARLLVVRPWDKGLIGDIERAIMMSDIGITPQNDGEMIRLPIPALNEERRKDLVKQGKHRIEEAKIALRNHRRDANDMLKDLEKSKEISQDDCKRALEKVQELTNVGSEQVEAIFSQKEKEILEI